MNEDSASQLESSLELNALRHQIREATRRAIQRLAIESDGAVVYGFALCAFWDGFDCNYDFFPSAAVGEEGSSGWSPFDWEYERLGAEFYSGVREFVRTAYNDKVRPLAMEESTGLFQGDVLAQLVLAVHDLRKEGAFSVLPSVTVFCSEVESDGWLERYSGKLLNTHALDAGFLKEYSAINLAYEERDRTFIRFRARLVQSGELPDIWKSNA